MRVNSLGPVGAAAPTLPGAFGGACHVGAGGVDGDDGVGGLHDGVGAPGAATGGVEGGGAGGRGCAGTDIPGVSRSNSCVNSLDAFGAGGGAAGSIRGASGACGGMTASKRAAPGMGSGIGGLPAGLGGALEPNT